MKSKKRLEKNWKLENIPWTGEGFWIESERRDIGNTVEHTLGYIYVQEAASMIPALVLEPRQGDVVLDMCAAPGSKTTQIAAMMQNRGVLVANDIKADRIKALAMNLQRCGVMNAITTISVGQRFSKYQFDKILIDAPCSGTGNIRRSLKTVQIWNPGMIKRLSHTQKSLIETGFNALQENGTLVYSTCSLEPEENEEVIDFLLNKFENAQLEKIKLNVKSSEPILEFEDKKYDERIKDCLRLWPQDNDTEGFFVSKIRKK
jgi:NOL1/NOP2/sun family putative RNA methylase